MSVRFQVNRLFLIMLSFVVMVIFACVGQTQTTAGEGKKLPTPDHPICKPQKPPVTPPPPNPPNPPVPPPPKPPLLPKPTPPEDLPVDDEDASSTEISLVDKAISGKLPKNVLPLWHGYPFSKVTTPNLWTKYAAETLKTEGQNILKSTPYDMSWHCPKYSTFNEEQKLVFWIRFLSIMAEAESTMNPIAVTRDMAVGSNVFSTGLLMLSIESAKQDKWGCSSFIKGQDDLFHWRKNMLCAIKIMNLLMGEDNALSYRGDAPKKQTWYGISRYWAPLRDNRVKTDERRFCIDEVIKLRRTDWIKLSKSSKHPSYIAHEYRKAGERDFERFLRLMNQFPYCN